MGKKKADKDVHVHVRFPDLEAFIREIRDSLLQDMGQLTFPKNCEFRIAPEDVDIYKCPDGNGLHVVVVMENLPDELTERDGDENN